MENETLDSNLPEELEIVVSIKRKNRQPPDFETFKAAAEEAISVTELGILLGYKVNNGLFKIMKILSIKHNVPLPVYEPKNSVRLPTVVRTDEEFFVLGLRHSGSSLKGRLMKLGVEDVCSFCGLGSTWLGKPLTIQVDHINGQKFDSRIENLRLLCGNCHAQTDTFRAKNKIENEAVNSYCSCGRIKYALNEKCSLCTSGATPGTPKTTMTYNSKVKPLPRNAGKYYKYVNEELTLIENKHDPLAVICVCKKSKSPASKRCGACDFQNRRETATAAITVKEQEKIVKRLLEVAFDKLGEEMGISGNALRKRLKIWGYDPIKVGKARRANVKSKGKLTINLNDLRMDEN